MEQSDDLDFLKEMKQKLAEGIEKNDPVLIEFVQKMIDNWIEDLEGI